MASALIVSKSTPRSEAFRVDHDQPSHPRRGRPRQGHPRQGKPGGCQIREPSVSVGTLETETAFRAQTSERRLKALQKVAGLDPQITKERTREEKRRLVAPVAGTVLGLKSNTVGGVVTAADTLMTIVPDAAHVEVEAQLPNKDVGFVHEGQTVEVKLETYTFTRFGTVPGVVRKLGRDAVKQQSQDGKQGSGELTYPVRIRLERPTISVDGRDRLITPGMKVTAEIKTEQRRVIEFLLDRVFGTLFTAGRER